MFVHFHWFFFDVRSCLISLCVWAKLAASEPVKLFRYGVININNIVTCTAVQSPIFQLKRKPEMRKKKEEESKVSSTRRVILSHCCFGVTFSFSFSRAHLKFLHPPEQRSIDIEKWKWRRLRFENCTNFFFVLSGRVELKRLKNPKRHNKWGLKDDLKELAVLETSSKLAKCNWAIVVVYVDECKWRRKKEEKNCMVCGFMIEQIGKSLFSVKFLWFSLMLQSFASWFSGRKILHQTFSNVSVGFPSWLRLFDSWRHGAGRLAHSRIIIILLNRVKSILC